MEPKMVPNFSAIITKLTQNQKPWNQIWSQKWEPPEGKNKTKKRKFFEPKLIESFGFVHLVLDILECHGCSLWLFGSLPKSKCHFFFRACNQWAFIRTFRREFKCTVTLGPCGAWKVTGMMGTSKGDYPDNNTKVCRFRWQTKHSTKKSSSDCRCNGWGGSFWG